MRKILASAALALLLPVTGGAQEPTPAPPPTPPAPTAPLVVSPQAPAGAQPASTAPPERVSRPTRVAPSGQPIVLEVSKGTVIRLPGPASTVFIANPAIADVTIKTPTVIYLSGQSPGETTIFAMDAEDRVLLSSVVRVEHDLSRMHESLRMIAPGENIAVKSVGNSLELSGTISSAARAERVRSLAAAVAKETNGTVINRLGVVTPNQVNIRVKVAEVNRQALKTLGVNWSKLFGVDAVGNQFNPHVDFQTINPTAIAGNLPSTLGVLFGGHSWKVQATLDALAQEGLVTTLAEPNLTTTNGQPASFLAGGQFPVPVAGAVGSSGAVPTISVEFKNFGVSLDVTPTILDAEHLNLRIRPEVSQLSTNGEVSVPLTPTATVTIPALTVTRADTTVELGSGESFLLAGLLQNNDTQTVTKIPWLGDIPMLGQLFRSQQFQRNESELVIIVTPYLAKPSPTMAGVSAPTDGYVAAHDVSEVINGGLYQPSLPPPIKGPSKPAEPGKLAPAGFKLD